MMFYDFYIHPCQNLMDKDEAIILYNKLDVIPVRHHITLSLHHLLIDIL